jgi:LemA protein
VEVLYVIAAILGVFVIWLLITYNRLIRLRNHCTEAWSNMDTELKRRYELIPNLVATVKGYATHEQGLFEEITRLRAECRKATGSPQEQAAPENALVHALNRLFVVVENYPELKASSNFLALQRELSNTEDRIQAARRFYNGNVRELNNLVQGFPSGIVASGFNIAQREYFQIEDAVRSAPEVRL